MPAREALLPWLDVIDTDLAVIEKCLVGPVPALKGAAYHCQQAAEKIVKALLVLHGINPLPIHDIQKLINMFPVTEELEVEVGDLAELTPFVSLFRYPQPDPSVLENARLSPDRLEEWLTRLCEYRNFIATQASTV